MTYIKKYPFVSKDELIRLIREAIQSEHEAIKQYEQILYSTQYIDVQEIMRDIANEEKVHIGELERLLEMLDMSEKKMFNKGKKEVNEKLDMCFVNRIADKIAEERIIDLLIKRIPIRMQRLYLGSVLLLEKGVIHRKQHVAIGLESLRDFILMIVYEIMPDLENWLLSDLKLLLNSVFSRLNPFYMKVRLYYHDSDEPILTKVKINKVKIVGNEIRFELTNIQPLERI